MLVDRTSESLENFVEKLDAKITSPTVILYVYVWKLKMHKARSKLKWQRRLVRRGEEFCGCVSDSSSAEVFLKPAPFVSLFRDRDYVHPLAVLKALCRRCTCASRKMASADQTASVFSLSVSHTITYLLLSFFLKKWKALLPDCQWNKM